VNKPACIACDLDGSLLNSKKQICPEDKVTIQKLKAMGVPVFVCTGRPAEFAKQTVSEIGFDYPVCGCNGGYIYDYRGGRVLYAVPSIPAATARSIRAFLLEKGYPHMIYTTDGPLFDAPDSKRTLFWKKQLAENFAPENAFAIRYIDDPDIDLDRMHILKVLVCYVPDEAKEQFERRFNQNGDYEVAWSDKAILDINTAGTNKGSGLQRLSELFHFDLCQTLVLGDNFNDTSMLKICGLPVVPQNGEEDVKAIARYVTADNDHAPLTHAVEALFPGLL